MAASTQARSFYSHQKSELLRQVFPLKTAKNTSKNKHKRPVA
jgi:hypothetical protein